MDDRSAPVYHLGIFREKVSLQPVECRLPRHLFALNLSDFHRSDYSKLPPVPTVDMVFLLDPLIATGGTAAAALHMILDWGVPSKHFAYSAPSTANRSAP